FIHNPKPKTFAFRASRRFTPTKPMNRVFAAVVLLLSCGRLCAIDANRLTYLDSTDPFYPNLNLAKLTSPQWVGESNVESVVVLAIDDMKETKGYEKFLRPILDRLKKI